MSNDIMLGGLYILMAVGLVLGSLMARREPAAKLLTMALAWIAIPEQASSFSPSGTISGGWRSA